MCYWWKGYKYFCVVKGKDMFLFYCVEIKGNIYNVKFNRIYFCFFEINFVWLFKIMGEKCKYLIVYDV